MISSLLEALPDFQCQDIDDSSNPKYFGFCRKDGKWYVTEETKITGGYTYRYAALSNNPLIAGYTDAWTARATLTYTYTYQLQI
jgi:hypothetical protein